MSDFNQFLDKFEDIKEKINKRVMIVIAIVLLVLLLLTTICIANADAISSKISDCVYSVRNFIELRTGSHEISTEYLEQVNSSTAYVTEAKGQYETTTDYDYLTQKLRDDLEERRNEDSSDIDNEGNNINENETLNEEKENTEQSLTEQVSSTPSSTPSTSSPSSEDSSSSSTPSRSHSSHSSHSSSSSSSSSSSNSSNDNSDSNDSSSDSSNDNSDSNDSSSDSSNDNSGSNNSSSDNNDSGSSNGGSGSGDSPTNAEKVTCTVYVHETGTVERQEQSYQFTKKDDSVPLSTLYDLSTVPEFNLIYYKLDSDSEWQTFNYDGVSSTDVGIPATDNSTVAIIKSSAEGQIELAALEMYDQMQLAKIELKVCSAYPNDTPEISYTSTWGGVRWKITNDRVPINDTIVVNFQSDFVMQKDVAYIFVKEGNEAWQSVRPNYYDIGYTFNPQADTKVVVIFGDRNGYVPPEMLVDYGVTVEQIEVTSIVYESDRTSTTNTVNKDKNSSLTISDHITIEDFNDASHVLVKKASESSYTEVNYTDSLVLDENTEIVILKPDENDNHSVYLLDKYGLLETVTVQVVYRASYEDLGGMTLSQFMNTLNARIKVTYSEGKYIFDCNKYPVGTEIGLESDYFDNYVGVGDSRKYATFIVKHNQGKHIYKDYALEGALSSITIIKEKDLTENQIDIEIYFDIDNDGFVYTPYNITATVKTIVANSDDIRNWELTLDSSVGYLNETGLSEAWVQVVPRGYLQIKQITEWENPDFVLVKTGGATEDITTQWNNVGHGVNINVEKDTEDLEVILIYGSLGDIEDPSSFGIIDNSVLSEYSLSEPTTPVVSVTAISEDDTDEIMYYFQGGNSLNLGRGLKRATSGLIETQRNNKSPYNPRYILKKSESEDVWSMVQYGAYSGNIYHRTYNIYFNNITENTSIIIIYGDENGYVSPEMLKKYGLVNVTARIEASDTLDYTFTNLSSTIAGGSSYNKETYAAALEGTQATAWFESTWIKPEFVLVKNYDIIEDVTDNLESGFYEATFNVSNNTEVIAIYGNQGTADNPEDFGKIDSNILTKYNLTQPTRPVIRFEVVTEDPNDIFYIFGTKAETNISLLHPNDTTTCLNVFRDNKEPSAPLYAVKKTASEDAWSAIGTSGDICYRDNDKGNIECENLTENISIVIIYGDENGYVSPELLEKYGIS